MAGDAGTFEDAVHIYRAAGAPVMEGLRFSGELEYEPNRDILKGLHAREGYGMFRRLVVDSVDYSNLVDLPDAGERVEFEFETSDGWGKGRFLERANDLAGYKRINKGGFPARYYLVDEDYLHGGTEQPPEGARRIESWAKFVESLRKLSDHEHEDVSFLSLLFLTNDRHGKLETEVTQDMLSEFPPRAMQELMDDLLSQRSDVHQKQKRTMFSSTMCDVLQDGSTFQGFIDKADNAARLYDNNLKSYVSGFSVKKIQREIADEQARFAERASGIISDIAAKLIGLPIALVAIFAVLRIDTLEGSLVVLGAVFLASWGATAFVCYQFGVLDFVVDSKKRLFDKFKGWASNLDADIQEEVEAADEQITERTKRTRRLLRFYLVFAWLPTAIVAAYVFWKHCL